MEVLGCLPWPGWPPPSLVRPWDEKGMLPRQQAQARNQSAWDEARPAERPRKLGEPDVCVVPHLYHPCSKPKSHLSSPVPLGHAHQQQDAGEGQLEAFPRPLIPACLSVYQCLESPEHSPPSSIPVPEPSEPLPFLQLSFLHPSLPRRKPGCREERFILGTDLSGSRV